MPVILPTPEELAHSSWRVQDIAHRRLRQYARDLAELEAKAAHDSAIVRRRMQRLEQQIEQASSARAEATRLLEHIPLDPPDVIAARREVAAEAARRNTEVTARRRTTCPVDAAQIVQQDGAA